MQKKSGQAVFEQTPIKDLLIYTPRKFEDSRGYFYESYNAKHFEAEGINTQFVQDNCSRSLKGTLRGLHLQLGDHQQAKLVSVLRGQVYDVAVDLRPDSECFGQWYGIHLSEDKPTSLYIPRGFGHGFVVLSEFADFFYKVDNFYNKESEAGIIYNDPTLAIDWGLDANQLILSDKDKNLPDFATFKKAKLKMDEA